MAVKNFFHNLEPRHRQARSQIIRTSLIVATVLGFLLVVYLIIDSGAAEVAHAMLVVGWWLLPITLFHLVPLVFSALSWRELLSAASRPDAITVIGIRWIRESINSLLPVASIGGDVASVRLAHLQGVPGTQAAASMVVDTTVGMVDAYILESLGSGVRAAAFMVPGALGALEGSYVLFGALFGLPADTALAISLSKRVRELALGVPGLLAWHWIEGHYLLRWRSKP